MPARANIRGTYSVAYGVACDGEVICVGGREGMRQDRGASLCI